MDNPHDEKYWERCLKDAVTACSNVYETFSQPSVLTHMYKPVFESVSLGHYGSPEVQFCVGITKYGFMVVSIRGSSSSDDWLQRNFRAYPTTSAFGMQGNIHAGFASAAREFPIQFIRQHLKRHRPVVICGHSLGGAIAALVAIRILALEADDTVSIWLRVFTFGAPCFADEDIRFAADRYSKQIRNYVHPYDPIPHLLNSWVNDTRNIKPSRTPVTPQITAGETSKSNGTSIAHRFVMDTMNFAASKILNKYTWVGEVSILTESTKSWKLLLSTSTDYPKDTSLLKMCRAHSIETYTRSITNTHGALGYQSRHTDTADDITGITRYDLTTSTASFSSKDSQLVIHIFGQKVDSVRIVEDSVRVGEKLALPANMVSITSKFDSRVVSDTLIEFTSKVSDSHEIKALSTASTELRQILKLQLRTVFTCHPPAQVDISISAADHTPHERIARQSMMSLAHEACLYLQSQVAVDQEQQDRARVHQVTTSRRPVPNLLTLEYLHKCALAVDNWISKSAATNSLRMAVNCFYIAYVDKNFDKSLGLFIDHVLSDTVEAYVDTEAGPLRECFINVDVLNGYSSQNRCAASLVGAVGADGQEGADLYNNVRQHIIRRKLDVVATVLTVLIAKNTHQMPEMIPKRSFVSTSETFQRIAEVVLLHIFGYTPFSGISKEIFSRLFSNSPDIIDGLSLNSRNSSPADFLEKQFMQGLMELYITKFKPDSSRNSSSNSYMDRETRFCDIISSMETSQSRPKTEFDKYCRDLYREVIKPFQLLRQALMTQFPFIVSIIGQPDCGKSSLIFESLGIQRDCAGNELLPGSARTGQDIRMYRSQYASRLAFRDFPGIGDLNAHHNANAFKIDVQMSELFWSSAVVVVVKLFEHTFNYSELFEHLNHVNIPTLVLFNFAVDRLDQCLIQLKTKPPPELRSESSFNEAALEIVRKDYQAMQSQTQHFSKSKAFMCVLSSVKEASMQPYVNLLKQKFGKNFLRSQEVVETLLDWLKTDVALRADMRLEAEQIETWLSTIRPEISATSTTASNRRRRVRDTDDGMTLQQSRRPRTVSPIHSLPQQQGTVARRRSPRFHRSSQT